MKTKDKFAGLRWTARVIGTLLVLFTLFIAIGEAIDGYHRQGKIGLDSLNSLQIITFIFWFLGLAGLILAWWKEGTGGFLSLIFTIIFLILVLINSDASFSYILLIFLFPALLYIIYWWLHKKFPRKDQVAEL
jgi:hypothetical protein